VQRRTALEPDRYGLSRPSVADPAPGQLSLWGRVAFERSSGQAIRAARTASGWGQRRLAAGIGVDQATISRLESGELVPTLEDLVSVGRVLCIPIESLLGTTASASRRHAIRPGRRPTDSRWVARQVPVARYAEYARAGGSLTALRLALDGVMPLTAGDAALLRQLGLVAEWPRIELSVRTQAPERTPMRDAGPFSVNAIAESPDAKTTPGQGGNGGGRR